MSTSLSQASAKAAEQFNAIGTKLDELEEVAANADKMIAARQALDDRLAQNSSYLDTIKEAESAIALLKAGINPADEDLVRVIESVQLTEEGVKKTDPLVGKVTQAIEFLNTVKWPFAAELLKSFLDVGETAGGNFKKVISAVNDLRTVNKTSEEAASALSTITQHAQALKDWTSQASRVESYMLIESNDSEGVDPVNTSTAYVLEGIGRAKAAHKERIEEAEKISASLTKQGFGEVITGKFTEQIDEAQKNLKALEAQETALIAAKSSFDKVQAHDKLKTELSKHKAVYDGVLEKCKKLRDELREKYGIDDDVKDEKIADPRVRAAVKVAQKLHDTIKTRGESLFDDPSDDNAVDFDRFWSGIQHRCSRAFKT